VIDLRMQIDPGSGCVELTGQILNSWNAGVETGAVDVIVLSGDRVVAKTSATTSGEFDLGFDSERDLRLFLNIRGQRAIGIELPENEYRDDN
jgi:hypothetical protein